MGIIGARTVYKYVVFVDPTTTNIWCLKTTLNHFGGTNLIRGSLNKIRQNDVTFAVLSMSGMLILIKLLKIYHLQIRSFYKG